MRENCSRGPHPRHFIQIQVDEVIFEIRDGPEVAGGFRQVQRVAAMSRSLGDAYGGGAHRAEGLVRGVHQQGMGIDAARGLEFHQVGLQQDIASAHVAQMLHQHAAHLVIDRLVVGRGFDNGNARRFNGTLLDSAPGHQGGAGGSGQELASGELMCHAQPQKNFLPLWRSRHQQVQGSLGQRPAGHRRRRAIAFGQPVVRHEPDAQPVQRVGGAHFAEKTVRHLQGQSRFPGRARRARRPGPSRWFPGRACSRSPGRGPTRDSSRRPCTCAAAGSRGPHRSAAVRWSRHGEPFLFPAPEWQARWGQPTRPSRGSRASLETRDRAWAPRPAATAYTVHGGGFLAGGAQ